MVAGSLGLVGATPASAAYAANGEPVWIPRNATNTADLLRADNRALAKIGNVVYVGGDFTELAPELGAPAVQQANLAAFNATTGVPIASFTPQLDGKVYAMVASRGRHRAVRGWLVHGWLRHPRPDDRAAQGDPAHERRRGPRASTSTAGTLYVGGQFQKFGGVNNRKMMAKLATASLTVDPAFAPQFVGGMVDAIDISPDHTRLYAGGRFTTLNSAAVGKVVALSQTNGALDPSFNPPLNTTKQPVEDIEALNTKVFVAFGGGYNRFVQFNAATGAQEYGSCGDGDVQEVHLVSDGAGGTVLLVGGHFAGNPKKNCTLDTIPTARIAEYQVNDVAGSLPVDRQPDAVLERVRQRARRVGVPRWHPDRHLGRRRLPQGLVPQHRRAGPLLRRPDVHRRAEPLDARRNVQVTAPTPGGFTVSWNPSTDNKGVAGYYVVVDGVRRATVARHLGRRHGPEPRRHHERPGAGLRREGEPLRALGRSARHDAHRRRAAVRAHQPAGPQRQHLASWSSAGTPPSTTAPSPSTRSTPTGALLGTTSGLSLAHSNLTPGSQHTYQVTAKDAGGNVSATERDAHRAGLLGGPEGRPDHDLEVPQTSAPCRTSPGATPPTTTRAGPRARPPLGYGKADITANGTTIGWGPSNSNRYLTSYARTTFTLADPTGITGMALKLRGTGRCRRLRQRAPGLQRQPAGRPRARPRRAHRA